MHETDRNIIRNPKKACYLNKLEQFIVMFSYIGVILVDACFYWICSSVVSWFVLPEFDILVEKREKYDILLVIPLS